jgi:hypothetical protein
MGHIARLVWVSSLSAIGFCQVPSSSCDFFTFKDTAQQCNSSTLTQTADVESDPALALKTPTQGAHFAGISKAPSPDADSHAFASVALLVPTQSHKEGFHWKRALFESFTFFSIEQSYLVRKEYHWVTAENGVPFNHYWSDYMHSLSTWAHSGWGDGDPFLDNYIGHPIQGALTGYIQVQNDPQGEKLEFSNTKAYWRSRLKAMLWNAVYSTQWEIGPLSEMTIEKYGTAIRGKWNANGTYPCTSRNCVNGTGKVDLVITPIGGLSWMVAEDLLDKHIARRVEEATRNKFLTAAIRCAVNPIRGGANILHGKLPWYRASRDVDHVYFSQH